MKSIGCDHKGKPHYTLESIKRLVREGCFCIAKQARMTAFEHLGATNDTIADVVMNLAQHNFYKSTHDWNVKGRWQDAYITTYDDKQVYVKFTIGKNEDYCILLITSFKENENEY